METSIEYSSWELRGRSGLDFFLFFESSVEVVFKAMGMEEIIKGVSEAREKTWTKD